jgi:hypothetical protein
VAKNQKISTDRGKIGEGDEERAGIEEDGFGADCGNGMGKRNSLSLRRPRARARSTWRAGRRCREGAPPDGTVHGFAGYVCCCGAHLLNSKSKAVPPMLPLGAGGGAPWWPAGPAIRGLLSRGLVQASSSPGCRGEDDEIRMV